MFFFFFLLLKKIVFIFFFFSSRRRHTRYWRDWSSDVCSSDLPRGRWSAGSSRVAAWPAPSPARPRSAPQDGPQSPCHRAPHTTACSRCAASHRSNTIAPALRARIQHPCSLPNKWPLSKNNFVYYDGKEYTKPSLDQQVSTGRILPSPARRRMQKEAASLDAVGAVIYPIVYL